MQYSITEFESIYKRCFPGALRLAVGLLHDEDEARDVVQEVFLKLWEYRSAVENEGAFILRATRNSCLNRIAAADTRERFRHLWPLKEVEETEEPPVSGPELQQALAKLLSSREREVVDKIYTARLSYKEAAEELNVSVALINKCIVNALKKLRIHFKSQKS